MEPDYCGGGGAAPLLDYWGSQCPTPPPIVSTPLLCIIIERRHLTSKQPCAYNKHRPFPLVYKTSDAYNSNTFPRITINQTSQVYHAVGIFASINYCEWLFNFATISDHTPSSFTRGMMALLGSSVVLQVSGYHAY